MRKLMRPFLLAFLRRDPHEVEKQAQRFRIETGEGRERVARLGAAFLYGYHTMLGARSPKEVAE